MPQPFTIRRFLRSSCQAIVWAALCAASLHVCANDEIHPPLLQADLLVPATVATQSAPVLANSKPAKSHVDRVTKSKQGPWGTLEYFSVFLEAPTNLIDEFPMPNSKPRWVFPLGELADLPALFRKAGLDDNFISALMSPTTLVKDTEMAYLFPPQPMLEAMTPAQRQVIYAELRRYPINEFHADPVLVVSGDADEWFRTASLRPELLAKFKQMAYTRGQALAFSDLPVLMSYARDEAEAKTLMKALTRSRALMVKLVLDEQTDLKSIMAYWSSGPDLRRKDPMPLLQSIIDVEGSNRIDIVHMLPPLPRKLLMTYPDASMGKDGIMPDCHWTSLNFFNYDAQPYLLDSRLATSAVLERFDAVDAPYKYGDILFFLDSKNGDAFHSCVYIADDIVFTKNGRNVLSPWIFMKLDDVKKIYLFDDNGRVQAFRSKKTPLVPATASLPGR